MPPKGRAFAFSGGDLKVGSGSWEQPKMTIVKIPHFNDNYYEVAESLTAVQTVMSAAYDGLASSLEDSFKDSIEAEFSEDNMSYSLQLLGHYQEEVGPQFLGYCYLLMITATVEKNNKLLAADGFPKKKKRVLVLECRPLGLLLDDKYNDLDSVLDDLFELRNHIAHSFGRGAAEANVEKVRSIAQRRAAVTFTYDKELNIGEAFLDESAQLLRDAYREVAERAYPE